MRYSQYLYIAKYLHRFHGNLTSLTTQLSLRVVKWLADENICTFHICVLIPQIQDGLELKTSSLNVRRRSFALTLLLRGLET